MRKSRMTICGLSIYLLLLGCSADKACRYGSALRQALNDVLLQYNGPGAVLAVRFDDGSVWSGAAGTACIGTVPAAPLTTSHRFRIGSVTKTFTGTAVLLLAEQGVLDLADTVDAWLPGIVPDGDALTVRMLLTHSSGLFDYTWDDDFLDRYTDNLTKAWTSDELIRIAASYDPIAEPGGEGIYSNTNYVLLGRIIEAAAGQPVEDFIYGSILEPLGLAETGFPVTSEFSGKHAHGYLDLNGDGLFTADEDVTAQHPSALWAAGAMLSTPADILRWIDELTDSTLLGDDLQAERLAFDVPILGDPSGFFGLGVASLDGATGHTGALPGYQTMLFRFRDTDFAVYCTGYLTAEDSVNIAFEIYRAALQTVFPDKQPGERHRVLLPTVAY